MKSISHLFTIASPDFWPNVGFPESLFPEIWFPGKWNFKSLFPGKYFRESKSALFIFHLDMFPSLLLLLPLPRCCDILTLFWAPIYIYIKKPETLSYRHVEGYQDPSIWAKLRGVLLWTQTCVYPVEWIWSRVMIMSNRPCPSSLFESRAFSPLETEYGSLIHDSSGCQNNKWEPWGLKAIFTIQICS